MQTVTRKWNSTEGGTPRRNKNPVSLPSHSTYRLETGNLDWSTSYMGGLEHLVQASTFSDSHRYHLLNVFCLPSAVIVTVRCRYYDSHFLHVWVEVQRLNELPTVIVSDRARIQIQVWLWHPCFFYCATSPANMFKSFSFLKKIQNFPVITFILQTTTLSLPFPFSICSKKANKLYVLLFHLLLSCSLTCTLKPINIALRSPAQPFIEYLLYVPPSRTCKEVNTCSCPAGV